MLIVCRLQLVETCVDAPDTFADVQMTNITGTTAIDVGADRVDISKLPDKKLSIASS